MFLGVYTWWGIVEGSCVRQGRGFEKRPEWLMTICQALQAAVQRIHMYVTNLEEKVDTLQKKK